MINTSMAHWSEILSNPLQVGVVVYLVVGMLVTSLITVRGMKLRRPPRNGLLWEKKDNPQNILFLIHGILILSPIVFLFELALWPLVLLFLWAYQSDDDE